MEGLSMKYGNSTEQKNVQVQINIERKMENGKDKITAFKGKDCLALKLIIQMYATCYIMKLNLKDQFKSSCIVFLMHFLSLKV